MKLHYTKILLFFFPLNILLTSYHAHNKNKPYITPNHTRSTTSRLLSEYDTESSIYDSDEEINSVKEIFERQTSRRFEEYEERMITQRQKYKEQRDKDIQKIILKDKMEKNLAKKIEKGCLRCGCGLGSVAGSIGLFGAVAINIWKPAALEAAIKAALDAAAIDISAASVKAGEAAGAAKIIKLIKSTYSVDELGVTVLKSFFHAKKYNDITSITQAVQKLHFEKCILRSSGGLRFPFADTNRNIPICQSVWKQISAVSQRGQYISHEEVIKRTVETMMSEAEGTANAAAEIAESTKIATIKAAEEKTIEAASTQFETNAFPLSVGIAFAALSYFLLKKKSKSSVDLLRVLNIPNGEYEMPRLKSKNRYIPYRSGTYKGKTYIYMEGDTSGDEDKYIWDLSSSDITSSESDYEEFDINDIYVPGSPKYKTLIEVVLEPSKRDIPSYDIQPTNRFTDEEWSELKHNFLSQYLPNTEPNNNYRSGDIPMNTEPNTLYFDKPEEKSFITSIHDRDLYTGEEISYNINMVNTNNDIPMSDKNGNYTGIDLINDTLSGEPIDIYDEVLKRKENELYGTKHPKRTSNNSVIKSTSSDPIDNQLDLFHRWLDRHRDMCEQLKNKEELLDKLKEEWNKDNGRGNVRIDNKTLNTNVSIQIDMDDGKPKKEFTNMDTYPENSTMDSILEDLEKYNEPYYDVQHDIYYDVNDHDTSTVDSNNMDVPSKV
ncbi:erythrocyte membrane protein 1, PfEMP1, putative [Plasmodium sp.]|nr:erythrocyte membrane protein 1, PfEMP1, putative [Plasmodium sp.]